MITKLELGWFISRWYGYLRWLKVKKFPEHKLLLMTNIQYHPLVNDFVTYTIDLPDWFKQLNLDADSYEAPISNSPPGSLTPPSVYTKLLEYLRQFYNSDSEDTIEVFPPRGYNLFTDYREQMFCKITADRLKFDRPLVCVFPRKRERGSVRNVPEFVWKEVVDKLQEKFIVVLDGTPNGACLVDYPESETLINQISYSGEDKMDKTITFLNSAVCSLSSQSGSTHLSLACDCPSYIIGHEKERHTIQENRLNTPTSFRFVTDYRAIDSYTVLRDIEDFIQKLDEAGYVRGLTYEDVLKIDIDALKELLVQDERSDNGK